MRAVVLHGPEKLSIENVPVPEVPEGWALVQVAYNSICGSDIAFYGNVWHGTNYPAVPGHEWSGTVVACRSDLLAEGERVVGDLMMTCGHCSWCRRSQRAMCRELREFGFTDPGGCADFVVVPAGNLFRLSACRIPSAH
jgi:D-arabinose 1-dehydrogenase-like Zn-dependent alcohol dehydrogenase